MVSVRRPLCHPRSKDVEGANETPDGHDAGAPPPPPKSEKKVKKLDALSDLIAESKQVLTLYLAVISLAHSIRASMNPDQDDIEKVDIRWRWARHDPEANTFLDDLKASWVTGIHVY